MHRMHRWSSGLGPEELENYTWREEFIMRCEKRSCFEMTILGIVISCMLPYAAAAQLVWQTSKQAALELAVQQNKKVLLLAGRDTWGYTTYMKFTVCEQTSPPVRNFIEEHYIPWYCDMDNSTEWYTYASGLGSFTLPVICVIDPSNSDSWLDRSTGFQYADDFYARLQSHIPSAKGRIFLPAVQLLLLNNWVKVWGKVLKYKQ